MSKRELSVNTEEQRNRLLERLRKGSVTTLQARLELDVFHPAARIQELREIGFNIVTEWTVVDSGKAKHRVASYALLVA